MAQAQEDLSKLSKDELVARLNKANEAKALHPTFKVGAKGGISVGGLGQRFPTTLYKSSWLAVLDNADKLRKFIADHESELAEDKH